ncbi:Internalin H [subsurface metagenome]
MKWRYLIPLVLVALFLLGACAAPAPEMVTFPDENLEAAIRDALGKPAGEAVTPAELAGLTQLAATMQGITDLSGIEYCINLTVLNIWGNPISDLSPLASLTNLTMLNLMGKPDKRPLAPGVPHQPDLALP